MASWLCVAFFSLATPALANIPNPCATTPTTTYIPEVNVTPAICFENLLDNQFAPIQANVKRIICPFLSTLINTGTLPMKKFYTRNELMAVTNAAGSNPQAGQPPFDATEHVASNFQFNAPGLIDIFNMEGNPNEHDLSTGIHDCETTYPCFDEEGRQKCTMTPSIVGRLTPLPIPVPNPYPTSPTATPEPEGGGRLPAFINFCPDILDHLPKCLWQVLTPVCGCTIPNVDKALEFWNTLDTNKDGLATLSDLNAIREGFAEPGFPPLSVDKNPVGSVALAGSFDLLNQIFATMQSSPVTGAPELGLNQAQFLEINVNRTFPSTYTFPGGCFVDPNEAVNQNNYTSPAAITAAGWTITANTSIVPPICLDQTNGISLYTGPVWFGSSAKVTVKGSGTGYVDFGNCADSGIVTLSVGGYVIATAYQNFPSKVKTFSYTDGQVIEISATSGTFPAVARVNFVAFNGTLVDSFGAPCPVSTSPATFTTTPAVTFTTTPAATFTTTPAAFAAQVAASPCSTEAPPSPCGTVAPVAKFALDTAAEKQGSTWMQRMADTPITLLLLALSVLGNVVLATRFYRQSARLTFTGRTVASEYDGLASTIESNQAFLE